MSALAVVDLTTFEISNHTNSYPRSAWSAEAWLDPGTNVPNCPAEYQGLGWWPVVGERAALAEGQTHTVPTSAVDQASQRVVDSYSAIDQPLSDLQVQLANDVKTLLADKTNTGFTYEVPGSGETHFYQIDDVSQNHMVAVYADFLGGATDAHGGFWRSAENANVAMADAQVQTFFLAAKGFKMALIRGAQAHKDAISLLDTVAAAVAYDTAAGWPSNP